MEPSVLDSRRGDWLDRHTVDWVGAGLISPDQASAIRRFEHESNPEPRLGVVAEVAVYLGSVIALGGGIAIVEPYWSEIGTAGRLAVALAVSIVVFGVAQLLAGMAEPGAERLTGFLRVVATGGAALAVVVLVDAIDPADEAWWTIAVGAVVAALGVGLWRNRDRPLQLVTTAIGVATFVGGWFELFGVAIWSVAIVTWIVSAGFGAIAAIDGIRPRATALAIAAVGMMIGAFQFAERSERIAAFVAVGSAAVIVVVGLVERSWPLVGIGLVAFLFAVIMLMGTVLEGTIARLVAVLAGLAVVVAVTVRAERVRRRA